MQILIGGECVMDQNSPTPLGKQNSLTPLGNNNLNFQLAHDQAVHLETTANLLFQLASNQANTFFSFFSIFDLGVINKALIDWPLGKQYVLFPQPRCFPRDCLSKHPGSLGNKTPCS